MQEKILRQSIYFKGLNDKDLNDALQFFNAQECSFKKGEVLNAICKAMPYFGLVLEGSVQVYMDDLDGNQIIMANNGPGESFGESLCYLSKEAPVYIVALNNGSYLRMNTDNIDRISNNSLDIEMRRRFIANLANRTLKMNNRIQILSKISIRDKLLTFFAEQTESGTKREITLPFNRNDMAVYLGVNRSALSRELSAMQAEGLIKYNKNYFTLL